MVCWARSRQSSPATATVATQTGRLIVLASQDWGQAGQLVQGGWGGLLGPAAGWPCCCCLARLAPAPACQPCSWLALLASWPTCCCWLLPHGPMQAKTKASTY
jgi:hypothetical protein